MSRKSKHLFGRLMSQGGSVAVWWALLIPLSFGVGGVVVDVGYAYTCQRELQMSANAAAMAAAAQLPSTTAAQTAGYQFSAEAQTSTLPKGINYYGNLPSVTASVVTGCVTITNLPSCGGSITANAVQVTQNTTIPTFFIKAMTIFGVRGVGTINLAARSTAIMRGAQRGPFDVALLLDTTASMQSGDGGSNCTGTKIQCAEQGAQILLSEFSPCLPGGACGTATSGNVSNAVDEVSLFTFPAQTSGTQLANDQACSSKTPSVVSYPDSTSYASVSHSNPTMPTIGTGSGNLSTTNLSTLVNQYQVVGLSSNYRTSDTTTGTSPLTTASTGGTSSSPSLVDAVGGNSYFGGTSCTGMQAKGGESTYYAGAMFTAQEYLAQNGRSNANNVLILLSDGDANGGTMGAGSTHLNSNGNYPSSTKQCQQAIDIATAAKAAGTKVYVVGYGVSSGGCSSDSGLSACSTLRSIASSDAQFYVDTSSVNCAGATTVTMNGKTNSLSAIFTAIAGDLTLPRMVPNNIAFTPN
jgi:Flp pilus assembly protein TadG